MKCFEHSPYLLCNTSSPTQALWVGLQFTTGFYNSFQLMVRPKAVNNCRAVKCTVKCFCLCIVLHIGLQQIKFLYRYQKIQFCLSRYVESKLLTQDFISLNPLQMLGTFNMPEGIFQNKCQIQTSKCDFQLTVQLLLLAAALWRFWKSFPVLNERLMLHGLTAFMKLHYIPAQSKQAISPFEKHLDRFVKSIEKVKVHWRKGLYVFQSSWCLPLVPIFIKTR